MGIGNLGVIRPRVLARITHNPGSTVLRYLSGDVEGAPSATRPDPDGELVDLAELSVTIDPLTRKTSIGGVSIVVLDDGSIREATAASPLFGAQIEILVGDKLDAESAYKKVFEGVILEITPEEGLIKIDAEGALNMIRDHDVIATDFVNSSSVVQRHPLQIIEAILTATDLPSSLIDSASLDPDTFSSGPRAMSHWNMARGVHGNFDRSINEPVSAFQLIDQLLNLMDGALVPLTDGRLSFRQFDTSATVVKTFADDEVITFQQTETFQNLINVATLLFGWKGQHASAEEEPWLRIASGGYVKNSSQQDYLFSTRRLDDTSVTDYAFPTESRRLQMRQFETKWVGASSTVISDINGISDPVTVQCFGGHLASFAGVERKLNGVSDGKVNFALNGLDRFAFLMVFRESSFLRSFEIMRATSVTEFPNIRIITDNDANGLPNPDENLAVGRVDFLCDRAQLGTSIVAHTAAIDADGFPPGARPLSVVDITIAVEYVSNVLKRFSNGLPIVELDVHLTEENLSLDLMDLVALNNDVFLNRGNDGVTTQIFEIVGKRLHILDDEPRVALTLALAGDPTLTTDDFVAEIVAKKFFDGLDFETDGQMMEPHSTGGLKVTGIGGLNVSVSAGANVGSGGIPYAGISTFALTDDSPNHLVYDHHRQLLIHSSEAGTPILTPDHHLVASVSTSGGALNVQRNRRRGPGMIVSARTLGGANRFTPNAALDLHTRAREAFLPNGLEVGDFGTLGTDIFVHQGVNVASGIRSIQMDFDGAGVEPEVVTEHIYPIELGHVYRATGFFLASNNFAAPRITVQYFDQDFIATGGDDIVTFPKVPATGATAINAVQVVAFPPQNGGGRYARVRFRAIASGANVGTIYLDRLEFEEISPSFHAFLTGDQGIGATGPVQILFDSVGSAGLGFNNGLAFSTGTSLWSPIVEGRYITGVSVSEEAISPGNWRVRLQLDPTGASGFANVKSFFEITPSGVVKEQSGTTAIRAERGNVFRIVTDTVLDASYTVNGDAGGILTNWWAIRID